MKLTAFDGFAFTASRGRELEIDETLSVGELTRQIARTFGADLGAQNRGWLLATEDGQAYAQSPARETQSVGEFLRGTSCRKVALAEQDLCMHGSPGVPGRGFLCGWC